MLLRWLDIYKCETIGEKVDWIAYDWNLDPMAFPVVVGVIGYESDFSITHQIIPLYRHTARTIIITTKVIRAVIHNGLSTHHHDHVITSHSFRTTKTIVNKPPKPMPSELLVFDPLIILPRSLARSLSRMGCTVVLLRYPPTPSA